MKKLCSLLLTVVLLMLCIVPSNSMAEETPDFRGMNDPTLPPYLEDAMYEGLVTSLNSENYFVENVQAIYISQEYLDELAYNSQANVYFGYTLEELSAQFQGDRYIFTLGDNNETVVEPWTDYDDTYERVIKNVAVGAGVILVCVTVSIVTAGAGAPAMSMIFAMAAKGGAIGALSGAATGGIPAFIATGIQTGDMEAAAKSAMVAGSEGFKWGAISGSISGGVNEAVALKGATLHGLTMNEAAQIQKKSKYPLDVIKQMHSMDEFKVYQQAGLKCVMVDGKAALLNTGIDPNYVSISKVNGVEESMTNLQRMAKGLAPIDPVTGKSYQLHHIGQKADATLAVLLPNEHQGNAAILNIIGKASEVDRVAFTTQKESFWMDVAKMLTANGGKF